MTSNVPPYTAQQANTHSEYEAPLMTDPEFRKGNA